MSNREDDAHAELRSTSDGSATLYSTRFDQHYHNPNGAVSESRQVFFEAGRVDEYLKSDEPTRILELGFGTGLNFLLLLDRVKSLEITKRVIFQTVEAYPITGEQGASFNYGRFLEHPDVAGYLPRIFDVLIEGQNVIRFAPNVELRVFNGFFDDFELDYDADIIFHDAFSPDANPDLWTGEVFKRLADLSTPNALMTTYCAAVRARAAMCWAGWKVARAPGALGKREMTVASLDEKQLEGLKRVKEEKLAKRYADGDFE